MKSFMKKSRRAFTIVELVIVIAVIAILAAVLIPTFASVISSANESADIQATKNMNTALYSDEVLNGKPSNLAEAKEVLSEAGYSDNLYPLTNNYTWYWNSYYNIVMLIDDTDGWELIYPQTDDAGNAYTQYLSYCYDINYEVSATQTILLNAISSDTQITVTSASASTSADEGIVNNAGWEDLVSLANNVGTDFAGITVKLDDSLKSSGLTITETDPIYEFKGTFDGNDVTVTIEENAITTVYGENGNGYLYSDLYDAEDGAKKYKYGYGLFASLTGGTIKNLTVTYSDSSPTDPGNEYTYFGGIVGILDGGTIENCTVSGTIIQYNRVGGIVGTALNGTITGCTVTANITSKHVESSTYYKTNGSQNTFANYSYAGGIVGYAGNSKDTAGTLNITNCTVGADSGTMTITADYWAAGGFVAYITKGETVNINNSTIKNVTVKVETGAPNGSTNTAGIICSCVTDGSSGAYSSLIVTNTTITNCTAYRESTQVTANDGYVGNLKANNTFTINGTSYPKS